VANKLPKELLLRISQVTNKRARIVLDTIAKEGSITTEQLQKLGYDHPPRAARDVRELGFTLVTTMVKNASGKRMAAYSLALNVEAGKTGRLQLPKKERDAIIQAADGKCQLCGATHDLQIDHRVPYQVAGETLKTDVNSYMVLCGTCNRRKSWICEHCTNFLELKDIETCQSCYWANPDSHTHVAMEALRRVDAIFQGKETEAFDKFRERCRRQGASAAEGLKALVEESGE
jgi:hypothetical protein